MSIFYDGYVRLTDRKGLRLYCPVLVVGWRRRYCRRRFRRAREAEAYGVRLERRANGVKPEVPA